MYIMIPLVVKTCWTLLNHVEAWLKSYFYNYHFNILQLQCPPVASKTSHSLQLLSCQASIKRPSKDGWGALSSHKGTSWRMSPEGATPKWTILSHETNCWDLLSNYCTPAKMNIASEKWQLKDYLFLVWLSRSIQANFWMGHDGSLRSRTCSSVESPFWNSMSQLTESVSTLRTYPGRQRPSHQTSTKESKST